MVPFPGWEPFEGPDSDDLSAEVKAAVAQGAIAVPASVSPRRRTPERRRRASLRRAGDDGLPEFSPAEPEWVEGGTVAELAKATTVDYVDIDSGHWPMYSQPVELARILAACTCAQPGFPVPHSRMSSSRPVSSFPPRRDGCVPVRLLGRTPVSDYEAWTQSMEFVRSLPGSEWCNCRPHDERGQPRDCVSHLKRSTSGRDFAYTVLLPDRDE